MATLFTARRKPKRIVRDESEPREEEGDEDTGPVVRRPTSNAPKAKSKLRVSFNPRDEDGIGAEEDGKPERPAPPLKPSRIGLSSAVQKLLDRDGDVAQDHDRDRPIYNKAYLDELRNSTPSTPQDLSSRESPSLDLIDPSSSVPLDLESKFGRTAISSSSRIPTAAEIQEKKERRSRLAQEQRAKADETANGDDFIPLEDYDSDGEFKPRRMQVGSYLAPRAEKDTRLVRDDEDIAEGFDDFVEDSGRVTLSKKGQREQTRKEREAIRALIDDAEGNSSGSGHEESDSDSEMERHHAYERTQTSHGMDGLSAHANLSRQAERPRQPREITPIPKLSVGLTKLRDMVSQLEFEKARIEKRRAEIARERVETKENQVHIQKSLEEAGQELENTLQEQVRDHADRTNGARGHTAAKGEAHVALDGIPGHSHPSETGSRPQERGLETLGTTVEDT